MIYAGNKLEEWKEEEDLRGERRERRKEDSNNGRSYLFERKRTEESFITKEDHLKLFFVPLKYLKLSAHEKFK